MGNVGPLEVVVVAIIALVVFGPKRLPELGRSLGEGIRGFKASLDGEDEPDENGDAEPAKIAAKPKPSLPASEE